MTLDDFARLVAALRRRQKDYFRTGSQAALAECKALEQAVDQAVKAILAQPDLFDEGEG